MQFNSRKEIIENIKDLTEPLPEDLLHRILDEGCIFGSYVFGGFKKGVSDIDVLLHRHKRFDVLSFNELIINGLGIYIKENYSEDEFKSIYVRSESDQIYNLIFFHNREDLVIWIKATHLMKEILEGSKYFRDLVKKHKNARIEVFEYLKQLQRTDWELNGKKKLFIPYTPKENMDNIPF